MPEWKFTNFVSITLQGEFLPLSREALKASGISPLLMFTCQDILSTLILTLDLRLGSCYKWAMLWFIQHQTKKYSCAVKLLHVWLQNSVRTMGYASSRCTLLWFKEACLKWSTATIFQNTVSRNNKYRILLLLTK